MITEHEDVQRSESGPVCDIFARSTETLLQDFVRLATEAAKAMNMPQGAAVETLRRTFLKAMGSTAVGELDARTATWRCRIRLYDSNDEPRADSDGELPPNAPGTMYLVGLNGVAQALNYAATQHHDRPISGLDDETLRHRLKGLRPTLSRRGGNAVWRVPYQTSGDGPVRHWMARVDIERVASG